MALDVYPSSRLGGLTVGEECSDSLNLARSLKTRTIASYTYKIYDSSETEVTSTLGGGSSLVGDVITFGIKAVTAGNYEVQFIITCNELLPDGTTPYEFYITMSIVITE